MIFDEIQEMIKNIFVARAKNVSDKVVNVWAKEIFSRGFSDLALKDTEKELMEDDETDLTLPKVLAIIYKNNKKYLPKFEKKECEYCQGLGYVYATLFFNKEGKYESSTYALKCYHNNNDDKCTKMVFNKTTNHKTEIRDGYVRVFKDIVEREEYLKKVEENNWFDLWVKEDLGNKETEVIEITEEDVPDSLEEI